MELDMLLAEGVSLEQVLNLRYSDLGGNSTPLWITQIL